MTNRWTDMVRGAGLAFDPLPVSDHHTFISHDLKAYAIDLAKLAADGAAVIVTTLHNGDPLIVSAKRDTVSYGTQAGQQLTLWSRNKAR